MIALTLLTANSRVPSTKLEDFPEHIGEGQMLWVDAENPTEQELKSLQDRFSLDSYSMEDVAHKNQRPKIEDQGKYVFAVIHIPKSTNLLKGTIEFFVFFDKLWIITIHSEDAEPIHAVDSKVKARGLEPITNSPTPDMLFYTFLDFAVDNYYPILDDIENRLEALDKQATAIFQKRSKRMENIRTMMSTVREVRQRLMALRRSLTPTRDMIGMVMRGAVPYVADSSLRSFRDVYDHSFQLLETIDNDRDRTTDVRDMYISLLSASTGEIIKVLTIVATILLPLSLLTGIYGMNFTPGFFEPGSGTPIGFYLLIVAMLCIVVGLLYAFRRNRWI